MLWNILECNTKDMVMETLTEKIERYKLRAELFLKKNTKAFIVDARDDYHFCYIINIGEDEIEVTEFTGKLAGRNSFINWVDILKFEEFRDSGR